MGLACRVNHSQTIPFCPIRELYRSLLLIDQHALGRAGCLLDFSKRFLARIGCCCSAVHSMVVLLLYIRTLLAFLVQLALARTVGPTLISLICILLFNSFCPLVILFDCHGRLFSIILL